MIGLFLYMLIGTVIFVVSGLAVWALVEMLKLIGAIGIIARITHFVFMVVIPAALLAGIIMEPELRFCYLLTLLLYWILAYVLTRK